VHEGFLFEGYHVVDEGEQVDETSRGHVCFRREIKKEVHHCVTHVQSVYQLQQILLLSRGSLLLTLIL
jgi:hypothetical protein